MFSADDVAESYGLPTPEELAGEYQKRGMRWTRRVLASDGGESCCALGMLLLHRCPAMQPRELAGMTTDDALVALTEAGVPGTATFLYGVADGNDERRIPLLEFRLNHDQSAAYVAGWLYGLGVRRLMVEEPDETHD